MSQPRPITLAIKELRHVAEEMRLKHYVKVDGQWPAIDADAHIRYLRLLQIIRGAENEWREVRQRCLRLSQIEAISVTNIWK